MKLVAYDRDKEPPPILIHGDLQKLPPDIDKMNNEDVLLNLAYNLEIMMRAGTILWVPKGQSAVMKRDKRYVFEYCDTKAVAVMEKAEAGDALACQTLRDIADGFLCSRQELPPNLLQFIRLLIWGGGLPIESEGIGPATTYAQQYAQRDIELVRAVRLVCDQFNLRPGASRRTSERKNKAPYGWWIVWQAAKALQLDKADPKLSERIIEERWNEHKSLRREVADRDLIADMELVTLSGDRIWPPEGQS